MNHRALVVFLLLTACSDVSISPGTGREGDAPGECEDAADNDADGDFDCDDEGCETAPACTNEAPSAPVVAVLPPEPVTTDTLTCSLTTPSVDPDGEQVTYTWAWTRNGIDVAFDTPAIDAAETARGETWACTATPSDGVLSGSPGTAAATVLNSVPTAPKVSVSPGTPTVGQDVLCFVSNGAWDADDDHVSYLITWTLGSTTINSGDLPGSATANGDHWVCTVVPFDGLDYGPPGVAEVDVHLDVHKQVDAGGWHGCAILFDGSTHCWGAVGTAHDAGQTSDNPQDLYFQVRAGAQHTCALRLDGGVHCWGADGSGQGTPVQGTFLDLAVGGDANCGVMSGGLLRCWGAAAFWDDEPPVGDWRHVAVAQDFACAIDGLGALACWNGAPAPPAGSFTHVDGGGDAFCALDGDGAIACWGDDTWGQVGSAPAGVGYKAISVGDRHACAVDVDSHAVCWGTEEAGQSAPAGGTFEDVSAGAFHSCGIRDTSVVACWGCLGQDEGQCAGP